MCIISLLCSNHTPTPHISTLSLHDALPILERLDVLVGRRRTHAFSGPAEPHRRNREPDRGREREKPDRQVREDRKSTRLNSSHRCISYAVFCLKKKNKKHKRLQYRRCLDKK